MLQKSITYKFYYICIQNRVFIWNLAFILFRVTEDGSIFMHVLTSNISKKKSIFYGTACCNDLIFRTENSTNSISSCLTMVRVK